MGRALTTRDKQANNNEMARTFRLSGLVACLSLMGVPSVATALPSFALLTESEFGNELNQNGSETNSVSIEVDEINKKLALLQSQSLGNQPLVGEQFDFVTFGELGLDSKSVTPIARLGTTAPTIGLDGVLADKVVQNLDAILTADKASLAQDDDSPANILLLDDDETLIVENQGINPANYLPDPQATTTEADTTPTNDVIDKQPNILQRVYSRAFNEGVLGTPRLTAKIYVNRTALPVPTTATPANDDGVLVAMNGYWHYETGGEPLPYAGELRPANLKKNLLKTSKSPLNKSLLSLCRAFRPPCPA